MRIVFVFVYFVKSRSKTITEGQLGALIVVQLSRTRYDPFRFLKSSLADFSVPAETKIGRNGPRPPRRSFVSRSPGWFRKARSSRSYPATPAGRRSDDRQTTESRPSGGQCVEARCVRRTAGVRRDVAVAGRRAGRRARAAARAGAARRTAPQVPRMLVLALPCVACSVRVRVRGRAARSQRSARPQPAPAPARPALAPRAPPARRHPLAPRRAIRRLRPVSTLPPTRSSSGRLEVNPTDD